MRLADRCFEHVCGGSPALAVRELDIEVDLDIGEVVAMNGPGVVAGAADLEAGGLGSLDGDCIDVHRRASCDGDEQQLHRGELTPPARCRRTMCHRGSLWLGNDAVPAGRD